MVDCLLIVYLLKFADDPSAICPIIKDIPFSIPMNPAFHELCERNKVCHEIRTVCFRVRNTLRAFLSFMTSRSIESYPKDSRKMISTSDDMASRCFLYLGFENVTGRWIYGWWSLSQGVLTYIESSFSWY